ncbi:ABC transporter ATP-binding protein [Alkalibacillus salilacus]|uniref:Quaternary amine transport ATP-binding protein n=1 Tax=Alkalibacillus salilacus TaxID=284582 RepID=A0ABT9VBH2_9BACI|nr:ABC transporter ATP-binding protein [Alkalibacillus salilacus]MDQ0158307.1 osmoprotectant transport system ATP-binding protein [Alkalibacillus salilacus]
MITFEHVSKQFEDGTLAVDDMNFSIEKGEFFVLIGPSGCGKTTSLKMMNRLIPLTEGTIFVDGKRISDYDINELRWNMGYVLQQIALFPHMTIEENISVVPELKQWSKGDIQSRVTELLQMVGLHPETYRYRYPHELSGGEQQRVGVIRALAADPDVILMDEPFSALDPISREKLQDDLIELRNQINKTIIFVTHDIEEAMKLGDRICLMQEGQMVQLGTPHELLTDPANDFVRQFVGGPEGLEVGFDLRDMIEPVELSGEPSHVIDVGATLEETLSALSQDDSIYVQDEKDVIGLVNRQHMIDYVASSLNEGGERHV